MYLCIKIRISIGLFLTIIMEQDRIIKELESRYAQYCMSNSDTMLYYNTKEYLRDLKSYEIVNYILDSLKNEYRFSEEEIAKHKRIEYMSFIEEITENREKYVAYVLQFLEWGFEKNKFDTLQLYSEASWLCSNNRDYSKKEQIELFRTELVYAITSYVIKILRNGVNICYSLKLFSERAMRFNSLFGLKDEDDLQNRIGLYLFDKGYAFSREENSGKGKPDFIISDDTRYVVEVKYVRGKDEKTKSDLIEWTSQLDDYINKYSSCYGILFIVTEIDIEYRWSEISDKKSIMNVYIGPLASSERKTKIVTY